MTNRVNITVHDDELLLLELRQNSKSAFNQLFEKYWDWKTPFFQTAPRVETQAVDK
jgi:hypothetical protein